MTVQAYPIDEAVDLLSRIAPGALDELRAQHPDAKRLLALGETAAAPNDDALPIRVEAVLSALGAAISAAGNSQEVVRVRVKSARRMETVAQVMTLITSASVWSSVAWSQATVFKVITGLISIAVSILLFLAARRQSRASGKGSLIEAFLTFVPMKIDAEILHRDLTTWAKEKFPLDGREKLIGAANALCRRILLGVDLLKLDV